MNPTMNGPPEPRRTGGPAEVLVDPRILVVDDNQAIHDDVRKILDPGGEYGGQLAEMEAELFGEPATGPSFGHFQIDSAFQGEEGLARVKQALAEGRPYAVAFVDVRMPPGWNGIETIRHIWREDPEIQVVICTAFADHSWPEIVAKLAPADGLLILRKPFDGIEIRQMVHALSAKWMLNRELHIRLADLERGVQRRTQELVADTVRTLHRAFEDLGCLVASYRRLVRLATAPDAVVAEVERAEAAVDLPAVEREVLRALDRLTRGAQTTEPTPRAQTDEHPSQPVAAAGRR
jgi:CheY-like chemotaxis protein